MNRGYLYIFSSGRIAKIKKRDGEIVWAVKLDVSGIKHSSVANVQLDGDRIYIGASGVLACVKESDGSVIWTNTLKGWGLGYVIFANEIQTEAAVANNASGSGA